MSQAAIATHTNLLAAGVTSSAFGAAGQRCLAGSLLVLVGDQHQQEASCPPTVGTGGDEAVTSRW